MGKPEDLATPRRFKIRQMLRFLRTVLLLFVLMVTFAPVALAQGPGTIFDEAGVLSNADKKQVQ